MNITIHACNASFKDSIPTKVGIQKNKMINWIPASAGMVNLFLNNRLNPTIV